MIKSVFKTLVFGTVLVVVNWIIVFILSIVSLFWGEGLFYVAPLIMAIISYFLLMWLSHGKMVTAITYVFTSFILNIFYLDLIGALISHYINSDAIFEILFYIYKPSIAYGLMLIGVIITGVYKRIKCNK